MTSHAGTPVTDRQRRLWSLSKAPSAALCQGLNWILPWRLDSVLSTSPDSERLDLGCSERSTLASH